MDVNSKSSQKVAHSFSCETCDYYTIKKVILQNIY